MMSIVVYFEESELYGQHSPRYIQGVVLEREGESHDKLKQRVSVYVAKLEKDYPQEFVDYDWVEVV